MKIKVSIIISIISIILILISYFVYNSMVFRVIGTDPNNILPTSVNTIFVNYNKELLVDNPNIIVTTTPSRIVNYSINKNSLKIKFDNNFNEGEIIKLNVANIKSKEGKSINNSTFSFKVGYVSPAQISNKLQNEEIQNSFMAFESNPLIAKLPHSGSFGDENDRVYNIDLKYDGRSDVGNDSNWKTKKDNYCVVIYTFADDFYPEYDERYVNLTLKTREVALDWLKSQGYVPGKDFNYSFSPLIDNPKLQYNPPKSCL